MARSWREAKSVFYLFQKRMKKLFCVVGCLIMLGSVPVFAQTGPEMAIVRIDLGSRRVIITREEGKSEVTSFSLRMGLEKTPVDVTEVYYTTIKKMLQEGYELKERLDASETASTLLFVKAPKP